MNVMKVHPKYILKISTQYKLDIFKFYHKMKYNF